MIGASGDDDLDGGDNCDSIVGGSGDDSMVGGGGFTGGDGVIEIRFDAAAQQLQADLNDNGVFDAGDLEINGITGLAAGDLVLT